MSDLIRTERRENTIGLDPTVWVLEDGDGGGIEVWPALGCNCYRWFVRGDRFLSGRPSDRVPTGPHEEILFSVPEFFAQKKPTRSGFPMLFPFPNRIRAGRFTWDGKEYRLPTNDPSGKNAIHGFACHVPWQVIATSSNPEATIAAEYAAAKNSDWPAAYRVQLTYRLAPQRLRVEARVENMDQTPLPFGLGYHPYFRADFLGDAQSEIQVPAAAYWELEENLPTGKVIPVAGQRDLRAGRRVSELQLDDVLTGLEASASGPLLLRGSLISRARGAVLEMWTSPEFRELVVFTPPHRKAIGLEPYTCVTDAVNLQQRGVDAGWRVLGAGEVWIGVVEMVLRLG